MYRELLWVGVDERQSAQVFMLLLARYFDLLLKSISSFGEHDHSETLWHTDCVFEKIGVQHL